MFKPVLGAAAAAVVLLALAGCSTSASTSSTGKSGTPASTAPQASARTYTAADLSAILTSVKKSIGSTGEIVDDTKLKELTAKSGGISSLLSQKGITIAPAACATLLTSKLPSANNGYGLGADAIGAALISTTSSSSISLASANGEALPASTISGMTTGVDTLLSTCGTMTMKFAAAGQNLSVGLTVSKLDVTTTGDDSLGIKEVLTLPLLGGKKTPPLTITIVEARKGNLIVAATDPLGGETAASLVKQVNSTLDAAAALK